MPSPRRIKLLAPAGRALCPSWEAESSALSVGRSLFDVRRPTFALAPLLLCFALTPSHSQPPGPPRPPGGIYDPYRPLVHQGPLPDAVQQALQGILLFPAQAAALPGAVHLKPGIAPSPVLPLTPLAVDPLTGSPSLFGPVRLPPAQLVGPSAVELPEAVVLAVPAPPLNGGGLANPAEVRFRALLGIARAARDAHRYEEAETIAAELVGKAANAKDRYAAQLELAASWHFNGKNAEAVALLRELLTREEPDASQDAAMWARYYLGTALIMLEKWAEAIPVLEAALARLPEPPCGYWHHMYRLRLLYRTHRCYLALGDLDGSARNIGQYLKEVANDTEREPRENAAVFTEVLRLLRTKLEVAGLVDGAIDLGTVPAGKAAKRTCTILKPRASDVEVTCDVPFVRPRVGAQRWGCGPCEQKIHFEFPADAPAGAFAGTATIVSKPPVEARLVVPVRGEVR